MTEYCSKCGKKLDENASFCHNCGNKLEKADKSENYRNPLMLGLIGIVIVLVLGIVFLTGGFGLIGDSTSILIISESPISNSGNFTAELTDGSHGISGKKLSITFKNDKNTYEFSGVSDEAGLVNVIPNVEEGDYEVSVTFDGDDNYMKSSASAKMTVEARIIEIDSEVTSTRTEPDYESFYYTHSFEDTDSDGDGYVYLSDMNIAHTPENIRNQMFADSDDDGDGRLNHNEYYKFMYKLNYDTSSYGL